MTAPFGRRRAVLLSRRSLGRYVVLGTVDELARAQPGQFYMLAAAERWGGGDGERPFLGRAVSVMRVGDDGVVEFLLEDVGPGTKRLCELEVGEGLLLVGPLGRGFSPPTGRDTLLVGGGIGIAPLVAVQETWGGRALLGFRDGEHAAGAELFANAVVATEDGSVGHRGLVSELLEAELARQPAVAVYACGPPAMLAAVNDRVRRHQVASELALEAPMACGFGACYGCVVATLDGYRRVCLDGPVFDGAVLV
jgi:dihydroorotate dehydrogenase electron transfer subunit